MAELGTVAASGLKTLWSLRSAPRSVHWSNGHTPQPVNVRILLAKTTPKILKRLIILCLIITLLLLIEIKLNKLYLIA
jgi:hypothetical protein